MRLSKEIAVSVAKELNEKDKLVKDIKLLVEDTVNLSKIISQQDKSIALYKTSEKAYKSIIEDNKKIQSNYQEIIDKENKKLRWSKTKTTISQILLLGLGVFTITKL